LKTPLIHLSAAAMVAVSSSAWAAPLAVIDNASGRVSVQTSKGFAPARQGTGLSDGSRIITGPKGAAAVSFLSGKCAGKHQVPAGSIAVVSTKSCLQVAKAVKAADLPAHMGMAPPPPVVEAIGVDPLIIGGGAILAGGAIACAAACPGGGGTTPVPFPLPVSP
jgi:hypothetical protein